MNTLDRAGQASPRRKHETPRCGRVHVHPAVRSSSSSAIAPGLSNWDDTLALLSFERVDARL